MKQDNSINYRRTDVDRLEELQDRRSQRLAKDFRDVWDSHEPLDLIPRMGLLTSLSIASWSLWQMSGWSAGVGVFLFLVKAVATIYFFYRYGVNRSKVIAFLGCMTVGIVFGIDLRGFVSWLL